ncbi:alpha/beta hydrolase [Microcella daejeonensis]|uniref:Alpha/beta hydrolase n=1 Tax=Microcella daejeonensis TaxID=2994971 RepID=A0A9E8SAW8_9MICO|nr:alpha/beta hydrolase [Microcella daejeonensis]WAB81037.1 alpha/beta hydrolase [Microcella daejeonensis]
MRPPLARVPVWVWRALMGLIGPAERRRFNVDPIAGVHHVNDVPYVHGGTSEQVLDVLAPHGPREGLPVYVYFHGGGWTSGDKAAVRKYCATQASHGVLVVNVNYRTVSSEVHMAQIMQDAAAALAWAIDHAGEHGGDPARIVVGGDSAGGQIAALLVAAQTRPELRERYGIDAAAPSAAIRGVVQHCTPGDFSTVLERGSVLGRGFVRMLLPQAERKGDLSAPARFLSPIEWIDADYPAVFLTTSERDYFHRASTNFVARARGWGVPVDVLSYGRASRRARHTWQQDYRHPESQEVYRRLVAFVRRVTAVPAAVGA